MLLLALALLSVSTDTVSLADAGRPMVVTSVGPGIGLRSVSYRDSLSPGLAGFQTGIMPLVIGRFELYPGAWHRLPVIRDLGVYGTVTHSADSKSKTADGAATLISIWTSWEAGLRYRLVLNGFDWGGLSLSYGGFGFQMGPGIPGVVLPAGLLTYARPALDFSVPLGRWRVNVFGGYQIVTSQNDIGAAFPHRRDAGVDFGAAVTFEVLGPIALRASAHYVRYFYTLNPVPGDSYIAGGAIDEYGTFDIGVVLHE